MKSLGDRELNPNPNLRVPAEWEPQACVYLAWPHNRETWPDHFAAIPSFFARWVATIAESTPVRVLASKHVATDCEAKVGAITNAEIIDIPTNDCWIRDYGPTFVTNQTSHRIEAVNWHYNAWGGKYPPWDADNAAAAALCQRQSIDYVDSPLCVEGGALELDGAGRLLATTDCLLTPTRNPGWTLARIEAELSDRLGVKEFCWLTGGGLQGDDTDGHIDQLARFVDPENIVAAVCNEDSDPNHRSLEQNFDQLCEWAEETTPKLTVHRMPIPPARDVGGQRVPESYCNFLRLGPERMLVPAFGATSDARAAALLRELTGLQVEPIDCRELVWGLGALHCASRDQPMPA